MDNITSSGRLLTLAEAYIGECAIVGRVANIAGFCRYLGISAERLRELTDSLPDQAEQIRDVFEDEALNSGMSPSLLMSYLKSRLGYGDSGKAADTVKVTFLHDVMKDGE